MYKLISTIKNEIMLNYFYISRKLSWGTCGNKLTIAYGHIISRFYELSQIVLQVLMSKC